MPIMKGTARVLKNGEILARGNCAMQSLGPERNAGSLVRLQWRDPPPEISEAETYRLEFVEDGRWLPIRFIRIGATACGPTVARFQGAGRLSPASDDSPPEASPLPD